jgi:hypothetical protein
MTAQEITPQSHQAAANKHSLEKIKADMQSLEFDTANGVLINYTDSQK